MDNNIYDLIILGGGPAGLTAGIYSSRASIKTLVIEGSPHGGQLTLTTDVENFPGFPEGIMGPALIENMRTQAKRFGTELVEDNVTKVSGEVETGFKVETSVGTFTGKTLILALGASAKWLGIPKEDKLRGKGISACATCDGFFFKGKEIAVVGGGDAAMEEATFLTKFASKVTVLVRGSKDDMKASKIMQERAFSNDKIEFKFNTEVVELLGDSSLEGIVVKNFEDNTNIRMENIKGLFVAIGHKPNTDFLKGFIELGKMGHIVAYDTTNTSKEGVFVAGDVADFRYRQAVTAAGLGCMAALDAEKYLSGH